MCGPPLGTYYTIANSVVHSKHPTLLDQPQVERGCSVRGRLAPLTEHRPVDLVDDLVVGLDDLLFRGFAPRILCVRFGVVIGVSLGAFVGFGRL